jgi:23S rRNA pseudouridine1911/1915/1917 synthase
LTSEPPSNDPSAGSIKWTVSPDEENMRLDTVIPTHIDTASRAQAKRWIESGWVLVDGKSVRPSRLLRSGEIVEVRVPPPEPAEPQPEAIPLDIVHEDDDLLVLIKPPHLVVHPAPGHPSGTLVNALLHHCIHLSGVGGVARPGIVHRLDQGTSGLLVVAKNDVAHRALARQFENRTVEKRYLALVYGEAPDQLNLEKPLGRDIRDRKKISSRTRHAKTAVTQVARIESFPCSSLLSIQIETGRTHQIRVHLSEAGYPLAGDTHYGRSRTAPRGGEAAFRILKSMSRPALHAAILGFRHPGSDDPMRFEIPLPEDIQRVVDELRILNK